MKRVLIVISTGFASFGGLTTVMMNYYRSIDKKQFCIDFASKNDDDGTLVTELNQYGSVFYDLGDRKRNPLKYYIKLKKLLNTEKYDVIHINANSATAVVDLLIAKLCHVNKRIIHIHNSTGDHTVIHRLLQPLFSSLYSDAIACSEKAGEWAFGTRKFTILNNAINTEKFSYSFENRSEIRHKYHISDYCFVIGNTGKLNKQKNHEFLIDLFHVYHSENENSVLMLVGDGPFREKLKEKVNRYHLSRSVIFLGMVSDVNRYLSAMDCFVFPSLWEGLPLSLVEAQANGLRCLASDRISREVNITGKIKFLSIEYVSDTWIDEINKIIGYNRKIESDENQELIKKYGYDVTVNRKIIENLYNNNLPD